jgi:hypothetical protein
MGRRTPKEKDQKKTGKKKGKKGRSQGKVTFANTIIIQTSS